MSKCDLSCILQTKSIVYLFYNKCDTNVYNVYLKQRLGAFCSKSNRGLAKMWQIHQVQVLLNVLFYFKGFGGLIQQTMSFPSVNEVVLLLGPNPSVTVSFHAVNSMLFFFSFIFALFQSSLLLLLGLPNVRSWLQAIFGSAVT